VPSSLSYPVILKKSGLSAVVEADFNLLQLLKVKEIQIKKN